MLELDIPELEFYDDVTEEFITIQPTHLQLEHSLISISKWEAKWHKAFFGREERTDEEANDYVRCMCITQNANPLIFKYFPPECMQKVVEYIEDPQTATWFNEDNSKGHARDTITNELIYYWMITLNIPPEYQKWHLNHLLTLIRVCNVKNAPAKKMSGKDLARRNSSLNAARKAAFHSKG